MKGILIGGPADGRTFEVEVTEQVGQVPREVYALVNVTQAVATDDAGLVVALGTPEGLREARYVFTPAAGLPSETKVATYGYGPIVDPEGRWTQ